MIDKQETNYRDKEKGKPTTLILNNDLKRQKRMP